MDIAVTTERTPFNEKARRWYRIVHFMATGQNESTRLSKAALYVQITAGLLLPLMILLFSNYRHLKQEFKDQAHEVARLESVITQLRSQLTITQNDISQAAPPPWLSAKVNGVESDVKTLMTQTTRMETLLKILMEQHTGIGLAAQPQDSQ